MSWFLKKHITQKLQLKPHLNRFYFIALSIFLKRLLEPEILNPQNILSSIFLIIKIFFNKCIAINFPRPLLKSLYLWKGSLYEPSSLCKTHKTYINNKYNANSRRCSIQSIVSSIYWFIQPQNFCKWQRIKIHHFKPMYILVNSHTICWKMQCNFLLRDDSVVVVVKSSLFDTSQYTSLTLSF